MLSNISSSSSSQLAGRSYTVGEAVQLRMAQIFKILADPTRLAVLSVLLEVELCVSEITTRTGLTQSSVSHHLKTLREADIVRTRRQGKQVYYRLADSHVTALLAVARDHARESL